MKTASVMFRRLLPVGLLGLTLMVGCQRMDKDAAKKVDSTDPKARAEAIKASLPKLNLSDTLSDEEKAVVVAQVDGQPLTQGQLFEEIGPMLFRMRTEIANKEYQIKRRGLEEVISNQLLEKEAKAQSITVEQLLTKEVDAKVTPPTDEELQGFFNQNRRRFPPSDTFEQHKEELTKVLSERKKDQAKEEYLASLKAKVKVNLSLPYPELPVLPVTADDDTVRGKADAPVQIIEFSDFQCPYCKRNVEVLKQVEKAYGDLVSFVYRDFPLGFHDKAQKAAEAAECAGDQGKYWEFHDALFTDQSKLSIDDLKAAAAKLGLDKAKFDQCLDSGKQADEVTKDMAVGQQLGITGTPAAFINGKLVSGALPFDTFQAIIDGELKKKGITPPEITPPTAGTPG